MRIYFIHCWRSFVAKDFCGLAMFMPARIKPSLMKIHTVNQPACRQTGKFVRSLFYKIFQHQGQNRTNFFPSKYILI